MHKDINERKQHFKAVLKKINGEIPTDIGVSIFLNEEIINILIKHYTETHRYFHTEHHIMHILNKINMMSLPTLLDKVILILSALFHDVSYNPKLSNGINEANSADIFKKCTATFLKHPEKNDEYVIQKVCDIILNTAKKTNFDEPNLTLEYLFNRMDHSVVLDSKIEELYEYETQIFKEYQYVNIHTYKIERIKFLSQYIHYNHRINDLIDYINNKDYNIAIYPGSFNPFHIGHLNILEQAEKMFDKVIVVKAINPDKKNDEDFNIDLIFNREIIVWKDTLPKLLENIKRPKVSYTIIRGLRDGSDLRYEQNLKRTIIDFAPDTKFSYFLCDGKFEHISSSMIRGLPEDLRSKYTSV